MDRLYDVEEGKLENLRFKHQKKCKGICGGKTFSTTSGNQEYCDECQKEIFRLQQLRAAKKYNKTLKKTSEVKL